MRVAPRADSKSGFVLMEALVAILLLALTLGLFTTTLSFGRRVAAAGVERDALGDVAIGTQALAGWLAQATAARKVTASGLSPARFEGQGDRLSFITLSNGDVLPGGLLAISVQPSGGALLFEAGVLPVGKDAPARTEQNIIISDVVSARFNYYGSPREGASSEWHATWVDAETLPHVVALQVAVQVASEIETMNFSFALPNR